MNKRTIIGTTLAAALVLTAAVSPLGAAKPQDVIQASNGFPSGAHFNLNIHGKDPATFAPDLTLSGGGSVFVNIFGDSTLTIASDKRGSVAELTALDPYAEAFDGDAAVVQLPYEAEGYYVFARILGKPGKDGETNSILLTPNSVPRVANYSETEGELLLLGFVTTAGVYELDSAGFFRFDPASKGKGKSAGVDVTGLFLWTGWVCDASLDVNGDGFIDAADVTVDMNLDGVIDAADFEAWLAAQAELGLATFYDNEWIFNIADVVEQDQTVSNSGAKLLQLRFYPVATTEFIR